MLKSEKISFRPVVSKDQLTELAERRGLGNLSDLVNDALAEYTGRHLDSYREFYRVYEEVVRLRQMLGRQVFKDERADLGDMLHLVEQAEESLHKLPGFSESYLRDFGKGK
jgi:hypothetical protein